MRPIKFRAWDKENEVMIYPKGVLFDGRVVNFSCGMLEPFEVYELMQYTGLKDNNGKEIYEGDIVETDLGKGIVVFDSAAFLIRNLEDDEYYGFDDFFSLYEGGCYLVEVIGNIYKHPHLLEGNNDE